MISTSSGAGKTTFGRRLAYRLGVPFVELDALHWGPGWSEPAIEDFRDRVQAALSCEGWVADGSYQGKLGLLVWSRADTLVWLDLPLRVALWRTLVRTLRRVRSGEELWSGNRESVRNAFFSRDSLLLYSLRTHLERRRRYEERLALPEATHLRVHRFKTTAEGERWLAKVPEIR